jgi:hypothetical protein
VIYELRPIPEFPAVFLKLAAEIGTLRRDLSRGRATTDHYCDPGDEDKIEWIGALGDLVSRYHLCERKIEYTAAKLFHIGKNEVPWDIKVGRYTYDVKGVQLKYRFLTVNKDVHTNQKADRYWWIKLTGETSARQFIASKEEVDSWPIRDLRPDTKPGCHCLEVPVAKIHAPLQPNQSRSAVPSPIPRTPPSSSLDW